MHSTYSESHKTKAQYYIIREADNLFAPNKCHVCKLEHVLVLTRCEPLPNIKSCAAAIEGFKGRKDARIPFSLFLMIALPKAR